MPPFLRVPSETVDHLYVLASLKKQKELNRSVVNVVPHMVDENDIEDITEEQRQKNRSNEPPKYTGHNQEERHYLLRQLTSSSQQSSLIRQKHHSAMPYHYARQGAEEGEEDVFARNGSSQRNLTNVKQNSSDISSGNGYTTNKSFSQKFAFYGARAVSDKYKVSDRQLR